MLVSHLRAGGLGGVGLDVLWQEPSPPDWAADPLLEFDNVIFTPHTGNSSQEMQWRINQKALDNIYRVAAGEDPQSRVEE